MVNTFIHCYIKYGGTYIKAIENNGKKRNATAYKMDKQELERLKKEIEKVLHLLQEEPEGIPQF